MKGKDIRNFVTSHNAWNVRWCSGELSQPIAKHHLQTTVCVSVLVCVRVFFHSIVCVCVLFRILLCATASALPSLGNSNMRHELVSGTTQPSRAQSSPPSATHRKFDLQRMCEKKRTSNTKSRQNLITFPKRGTDDQHFPHDTEQYGAARGKS